MLLSQALQKRILYIYEKRIWRQGKEKVEHLNVITTGLFDGLLNFYVVCWEIPKILDAAKAGKTIAKKEGIPLEPLLSDIFRRLKPSDLDGDISFHLPELMAVLADPAA